MNRLDIRVHPKYAKTGIHNEAVIAGWIKFSDKRPVDLMALPLFCDSFPPSVFTLYGPIGWVPTLELSVHVRRQPQSGWIKAAFNTNDLAGDLFIEDGMLWDKNDQLVAQSRQLQMILS
jgi:acyl-CoA thioesterase